MQAHPTRAIADGVVANEIKISPSKVQDDNRYYNDYAKQKRDYESDSSFDTKLPLHFRFEFNGTAVKSPDCE